MKFTRQGDDMACNISSQYVLKLAWGWYIVLRVVLGDINDNLGAY
jgi:hypothetical protein